MFEFPEKHFKAVENRERFMVKSDTDLLLDKLALEMELLQWNKDILKEKESPKDILQRNMKHPSVHGGAVKNICAWVDISLLLNDISLPQRAVVGDRQCVLLFDLSIPLRVDWLTALNTKNEGFLHPFE